MEKVKINVNILLEMIGRKEVEIEILKDQVNSLQTKLKAKEEEFGKQTQNN